MTKHKATYADLEKMTNDWVNRRSFWFGIVIAVTADLIIELAFFLLGKVTQ